MPEIGRRYNKGKTRYELIPYYPLEQLALVYTRGAEKYTLYNEDGTIKEDGAQNWRKGLPFSETVGSLLRHIHAWQKGEDIDPDLGTPHLANAAFNLFALMEYSRTHPEMDDRIKEPDPTVHFKSYTTLDRTIPKSYKYGSGDYRAESLGG